MTVIFNDFQPLFYKQEKRGRPKKRVAKDSEDSIAEKKEKPVKNARTRSGRITRPPKYIEKVSDFLFSKIDVTKNDFIS